MPDIANEELGRRMFVIRREKAVEEALEKIRRHLGAEWDALTTEDIDRLNHILGEMWVTIERTVWQQYAFARLTKTDVDRLVILSAEQKMNQKSIKEAATEFDALLTSR
jgi:hypothetical protein